MGRRREKFSGDLLNLMERRGRKNISLELYFIPGLSLACVQTPLPFPLRKNRLLLQVNAEFIFDSECLSANSGDKGLFKPEDNLQIADVRRVVISSCCSCYVFSKQFAYYFLVKRVKCSAILQSQPKATKTTQPRPQIFSVNGSIIKRFSNFAAFHLLQNSPKFGPHSNDQLVIMKHARDFSQSETEKYFK